MPVRFPLPRIRASRLVTAALAVTIGACGASVVPSAQPSASTAQPSPSPAASFAIKPSFVPTDAPASAMPVTDGSFGAGPDMAVVRASHTATRLLDDRVLVAGGYAGDVQYSSAELVDAKGATFEATGRMASERYHHTATLLGDGKVLVVGGSPGGPTGMAAAEVFDPVTGTFAPAGTLAAPRLLHSATRLQDDRVLIVGGTHDGMLIGDAEIWDPDTGEFSAAGTLTHPRAWTTATLLSDGRVLVAGGVPEAEIWDPKSNSFAPAGVLREPRWWGTATLLPDDHVLVIGGLDGHGFGTGDGTAVSSAEDWDPVTATFSDAGTLVEARGMHSATRLDDGRVLVIGGAPGVGGDSTASLATSELWDPDTSTFTLDASMLEGRFVHTATSLPDHRILVVGGETGSGAGNRSTELWTANP